ncbi:VOC family protein [Synechocystis sp. LKSZ1]|uniref:VOC family protein n=1 Tax=Synechocystis sp. LKSZ1 TaxID=3144951 RepID=UPI00336BEBED
MIEQAFLTIGTEQFETVVAFYQAWLQQGPDRYQAERYAEFHLPGLTLGIFRPQSSHQREFQSSTGSGFSLCLEVTNLETAIAELTALGYPPRNPIQETSHGREVYGYDPAGNRIILHQI